MEEMNLEEMRQQMAILKHKLAAQKIVTDRMIKEATKTKVNTINSVGRNAILCATVSIAAFPMLHYYIGFSWALVAATCAMMLFCIIATNYIHRPLHDTRLMTSDVATVARVMARFKRQYDNWLRYVTPTLLLPWLLWASYEYTELMGLEGTARYFTPIPLLVGSAIGGVIGYRLHRKAVRMAEEIIDQLEE